MLTRRALTIILVLYFILVQLSLLIQAQVEPCKEALEEPALWIPSKETGQK